MLSRIFMSPRLYISLVALATAIGVAYVAIWAGLGFGSLLSSANTTFAVKNGLLYALLLVIVVNCILRNKSIRVSLITITALHLLYGFGLLIWTAAIASV